jgi:glucosyl-dolichyl phosphate glucuronosyltransferase
MNEQRVTISLTRFQEPDLLVAKALQACREQMNIAADVLFLDQQPGPSLRGLCSTLSNERIAFRVIDVTPEGLSAARNRAIAESTTSVVLYIDADARPDKNWARALATTFATERVGVVGSRILPEWPGRPPLPSRSSVVQEFYSLLDLGSGAFPVPKVVGAGFGLHKHRLGREAYFKLELGRRDGNLAGGEETDLCRRAAKVGLDVFYQGAAVVYHRIQDERITWWWLMKRIHSAGRARAQQNGRPEPYKSPTAKDYMYLMPLVPA